MNKRSECKSVSDLRYRNHDMVFLAYFLNFTDKISDFIDLLRNVIKPPKETTVVD